MAKHSVCSLAYLSPTTTHWEISTPGINQGQSKHYNYRKVSNIRRILVSNKIVDHSDVVGASPVGTAPTTSSFST